MMGPRCDKSTDIACARRSQADGSLPARIKAVQSTVLHVCWHGSVFWAAAMRLVPIVTVWEEANEVGLDQKRYKELFPEEGIIKIVQFAR